MRTPRTRRTRLGVLAALIAAAGVTSVEAQDHSKNVAQSCLYRTNVDHTKVLDDQNILFFMRDRSIYQNTLTDRCYALKSTKRFGYSEAPMHRICMGSLISVLEDLTPGAVSRNSLCKLGAFVPVDDDVADELIAAADPSRKKEVGKRQAIKAVPVELPPAAEPQPAPADAAAASSPVTATPPTAEPAR